MPIKKKADWLHDILKAVTETNETKFLCGKLDLTGYSFVKAKSLKGNSLRVNGWNVNKVGRAAQAKKIPKP